MSYFNTNSAAFNFLAQHNPHASPNRTYNLLPENLFVDALGEDNIQDIARLLHYHNLPWQEKLVMDTIDDDIQHHHDMVDINQKINHVMQYYLTADQELLPLSYPGYVANGYEVAYINSDGIHTIDDDIIPTFVSQIKAAQDSFYSKPRPQPSRNYDRFAQDMDAEQAACQYDPMSPVPLQQRPGAFACWLEQTLKKPFSFSLRFPDYQ